MCASSPSTPTPFSLFLTAYFDLYVVFLSFCLCPPFSPLCFSLSPIFDSPLPFFSILLLICSQRLVLVICELLSILSAHVSSMSRSICFSIWERSQILIPYLFRPLSSIPLRPANGKICFSSPYAALCLFLSQLTASILQSPPADSDSGVAVHRATSLLSSLSTFLLAIEVPPTSSSVTHHYPSSVAEAVARSIVNIVSTLPLPFPQVCPIVPTLIVGIRRDAILLARSQSHPSTDESGCHSLLLIRARLINSLSLSASSKIVPALSQIFETITFLSDVLPPKYVDQLQVLFSLSFMTFSFPPLPSSILSYPLLFG